MTQKCRRAKRRRYYSSMKYSATINNACKSPPYTPCTRKREQTYNVRSLLYYACFVDLTAVASKMCFPIMFNATPRETLIKSNSPRSNGHIHAAEFDTLRFNHRIPSISFIDPLNELCPWVLRFRRADACQQILFPQEPFTVRTTLTQLYRPW